MTEIIEFLNKGIARLIAGEVKVVFTNTGITPAMIDKALSKMGYTFEHEESNGWEHDCWLEYANHDTLPPVTLFYSGFNFEVELYLTEDTEEE